MIELKINRGEVEIHLGKQEVHHLIAELANGAIAALDSIAYNISTAHDMQVSPEILLDEFIEILKDARNEPDVWEMEKKREKEAKKRCD